MRYAIITGATQGIGKAITEKLLTEGFSVAICARTLSDLEALRAEWTSKYQGQQILIYAADMGKTDDVKAFAEYALKTFPAIDILVNNAGTFFPGKLADEAEGHLETLMSVNLYSAYHITRSVLPTMKQAHKGHIFNMCSVASLKSYPNGGSYGITKYALLGFSENLREELIPDNIKVTAICPGATYTNSWSGARLPQERFIQVEDIASALWSAYVLSEQAVVETIVIRPLKGDL
ncbi:MAG: SDR family oxidoreductase [Bacteroidetes bacterium]|nr:SDR family oxidoreductase [Bacteroidota bacterium]